MKGDRTLRSDRGLTHSRLFEIRRRGLRDGNWAPLRVAEKALFRCALWVAKVRGKISNSRLVAQVMEIASKLLERFPNSILRAGRKRAAMMLNAYEKPLWSVQLGSTVEAMVERRKISLLSWRLRIEPLT